MLSYAGCMANTKSAKKQIRQSARKKANNLFWKKKIKSVTKTLRETMETKNGNTDILVKEQSGLQKVLDKAAKNRVIHRNKASRLKSRYAKKIAAQSQTLKEPSTKVTAKPKSKSKRGRAKS
jgi:small subunit ribosomal protein S20